jgi:mannose-1-phosphate guanylyltransferase
MCSGKFSVAHQPVILVILCERRRNAPVTGDSGAAIAAAAELAIDERGDSAYSSRLIRHGRPSYFRHRTVRGRRLNCDFGVKPTYPALIYGCISAQRSAARSARPRPRREAQRRNRSALHRRSYLWKSDDFVSRAEVMLRELVCNEPQKTSSSQWRPKSHRLFHGAASKYS